jgi:hypothetical protein
VRRKPRRCEMAPIEGRRSGSLPFILGHATMKGRSLAAPAREGPREGVDASPTKTGAGVATGASEVGRVGCSGNNTPRTIEMPHKGARDTPKRRKGGDVIAPLPRPRDGSPKPIAPPKA